MKKIFIFLALVGGIFSSCKDFLKEENLSSVVADNYYLTNEGFESLVNANYSLMREIYGSEPYMFCSGTDLYVAGRNPGPEGLSKYFELGPNSVGINTLYNSCYQAIQASNMALFYYDKTAASSTLKYRKGEIQYLRAFSYFLLVQSYGGVSLVKDYIKNPLLSFSRNSSEEVYAFIISELESALTLVIDGTYNGRVNKRAVQHLLSKVYLTRGYEIFGTPQDFTKAATLADAAINNQKLNLTFANLWKPGNERNEEVLFSIQFEAGSISTAPTDLGHMQANFFSSYLGGSEVAGKAPFRVVTLCPTAYALDLFTQQDQRWGATFMEECYTRYYDFYDVADRSKLTVFHYYAPKWASSAQNLADYKAAHPTTTIHKYGDYEPSVSKSLDYSTIPVRKFDDPKSAWGGNGKGRVSTRDIILSRLGETYLIAAEAYLKSGNVTSALDRINEVRRRAGVPNITAADMNIDFLLDERGRELLGEYHRWFDLKRTGTLVDRASKYNYLIVKSNFNGNNGLLKILRPIPQEAIDLNQNKDFAQNPAYN